MINYNKVLRELLSNGTGIPLDLIYKQGQNDGLVPPSKDTNWASYRLTNPTSEPYAYKQDQKLFINYSLNYNISIYGRDNLLLFQKFNAYIRTYPATIILHHNDMQFKDISTIVLFDELVNNLYYSRLDVSLDLVAQYRADNLGYIDKDTIKINFKTERG